jgi:hypothetical protein
VSGVGVGHWGGGGVVEGESVWFLVVDLEVEVASGEGDRPCGGVVVGESGVLVKGSNDSFVSFGREIVNVQIANIHPTYLKF